MITFLAEISNGVAVLTEEESWHCAKVLRHKPGDRVRIIDGLGKFYDGILESVHEKKCLVRLDGNPVEQKPRPYQLHLAIAPTKQIDRLEWMVEKCVEIGIDEITFLQCHNSERVHLKVDRFKKIVLSAVKQSLQSKLPLVNDLISFNDFMKHPHDGLLFVAHCHEGPKLSIQDAIAGHDKITFLIGPEGDFSKEEVDLAITKGFQAVSLGDNRLRTETAGLYACQAVSILATKAEK